MNPQKMRYLEKIDNYIDSLKVGKSAIVDSWFMMSSPIPIVSVVTAYLLLVRIGPRLMKNRSPLKMNKLLAYYNAFQVILAATICVKLLDVGWWYFFAKFTELLDTVFFVLRKKEKQISFLHVYHHVIMALYSWSYLKFAAGGEGAILALLNSIVHVFMYTYYLLAGLGPRFHKYLWWKKYVTKMQLTQFILMLLYCAWTHFSPRCQYAAGFTYFISGNVVIFLVLFLNFYANSYTKKKKDVEKEINSEYAKTHDESKRNGVSKQNGLANGTCQAEDDGLCGGDCKRIHCYKQTVAYNNGGGDLSKDTEVLLTRRINTTTFAPELDFDSIIQK